VSTSADIAESLVTELNEAAGGTFSFDFKAERRYVPAVDLRTLGTGISVLVVPRADGRELLDRGGDIIHDILIDIGIQKKLGSGIDPESADANPEIDAFVAFVEEVAGFLRPGLAATVAKGTAQIRITTIDPLFRPDHLVEKSVLTSVVTVALKFA
jgi:hypothetical protein